MLFPTAEFAIFFAVVLGASYVLGPAPRAWKLFIAAASYFFYAWWDWHFVFLLAASTGINQLGGLGIAHARSTRARRAALIGTVAANLALLGWFKYYGFFAENVSAALRQLGLTSPLPLLQIVLPIAISFITFSGLSYVIDIYRGQLGPAGWLDFAASMAFFPHLVAGPIVRQRDLLPQLAHPDSRQVAFAPAAMLILGGLFKKVVLSSYVATQIVEPVFAVPLAHSSGEILVAIYGYAVQIYADFSGYTDMAIGIALLLGVRFPQNFNNPYGARSLHEFWQRWHITLSTWLRDYLYVPLGGSRGARWLPYRNLLITMALGGLWHGAAWTFVIWGLIHGVVQAIERGLREHRLARGLSPFPEGRASRIVQRLVTFHVVCLGWVFFRAESLPSALQMLGGFFGSYAAAPLVTPAVLLAIAVGIGSQYVPPRLTARIERGFERRGAIAQGLAMGTAVTAIGILGPEGVAPFIYWRF